MFSQAPIAAATAGSDPNVQVHLRTTTGNLAVLDQIVVDCGAGDRSRLIAAALDSYLPPIAEPAEALGAIGDGPL